MVRPRVMTERQQVDARAAREQVQTETVYVAYSPLCLPSKISMLLQERQVHND